MNNFQSKLNKYNTAAEICGKAYKLLVSKINENERDISKLCDIGNDIIKKEISLVYKKEVNKGIAFPVCISLNNCVGYYVYEKDNDKYNTIKDGDIVKIEMGVNIGGCIARLGETIVVGELDKTDTKKYKKKISMLNKLQNVVYSEMYAGNINDEVRINIETICNENSCYPVENSFSYQHLDNQFRTDDSKYVVLNHVKYYDEDDNEIVEPNDCFDLLEEEVYTIELRIVDNDKTNDLSPTQHKYVEIHDPHIFRFNNYHYDLKSKNARLFLSKYKGEYGTDAFCVNDIKRDVKNRIGIKECYENGILESYPVKYVKDMSNVYLKIFTVVVFEDKCYILKYSN
jgi:methionine aminopeptidase